MVFRLTFALAITLHLLLLVNTCTNPCLNCTANNSTCTLCPAGYGLYGSSCIQCLPNTYSNGSIICTNCPNGTYSTVGCSSCSACAVGCATCSGNTTSCGTCLPGYVMSIPNYICNPCSANS
jgi:hypothetical protein